MKDDLLNGLSEFIELVRSGDFYKDYDLSMELLGKADAALKAFRTTPAATKSADAPVVSIQQMALARFNVHEYVDDYEYRGDQDYKPNEHERALLEDAICGAIAEIEAIHHNALPDHGGADAGVGAFSWKQISAYEACNGTIWRTADEARAESKRASYALSKRAPACGD